MPRSFDDAAARTRLAPLLREQDGLLTRQQALDAGLTAAALRWRCREGGPWVVVCPGVLSVTTGALTEDQRLRAALLHAGGGAALTGPTACRLHGLRYLPVDDRVHVQLPHVRRCRPSDGMVVHRSRRTEEPLSCRGLPVVSVARAVAATCRQQRDLRSVRALVAEAVQRGRCSVDTLVHELDTGPRRGSGLLRTAVEDVVAGVRSVAEAEASDLVRSSLVLPEPRWNCLLADEAGRVVGRPDAWWPDADLVLEVDSVEWHLSPERHRETLERHARLEALGLHVVHVTPAQIRESPGLVLRQLEALYRRYCGTWCADVRPAAVSGAA